MPTHYRGTDEETRALNAWISLARATNAVGSFVHGPVAAAGLTVTQFGALETLLHLGPLVQRELASKLLTSPGNVVMVLDHLERRGLVRRERHPTDRRAMVVGLTDAGRALIEQLFPKHARTVAEAFSVLEPEEQEALHRLCRKLGLGQAVDRIAERCRPRAERKDPDGYAPRD